MRLRESLNRLHIWQKLTLLGAVFALLLAIPTALFLQQVFASLATTSREVLGIERSVAAMALIRSLAQHGALSAGQLGGDASLAKAREQARLEADANFENLRKRFTDPARRSTRQLAATSQAWKGLADAIAGGLISGSDSLARHAEFAAQLGDVLDAILDEDGLAVDTDMTVHYLMQAAFVHAPGAIDAIGHATATGMGYLASKQATAEERTAVVAVLERVREIQGRAESALAKAFAGSAAIKGKLTPLMAQAKSDSVAAIRNTRVDVVFNRDLSAKPEQHATAQGAAMDGHLRLSRAAAAEAHELLHARAAAERSRIGIALAVSLAAFLGAAWLAVWTTRSITRPIGHAVTVADGIASGNLDQSIDAGRAQNAEAARLLQAFKAMQGALSALAREIQGASHEIQYASMQVASGNSDLSARTENQASSLEETAATMEELTATVKRNAESAHHASEVVTAASESAMRGAQAVSEVVNTMQSINAASKRIVDIIGVIDSIAFQTNILALNAAVEAARAGEHGRGFAVVASEVRNLARRSADSAKEIKALIAESVQAASLGAKRVDETGRAMDDIMESVHRVSSIFSEINAASQEQRNGIEQVNKAVTQMDRTTQENAALVGEVAASSQSLQEQAQRLAEVVGRFRLAREAAPAAQHDMRAPGPVRAAIAAAEKLDLPRLTAAR